MGELSKRGLMAPPPERLEEKGLQSAFSRFECKSVLKADGAEYDKICGTELRGVRKYDAHFRPMFPITNRKHRFSVVSKFGLQMLQKYGYKEGEGLGRLKQGVSTFPRLMGQVHQKGVCFSARNHQNLSAGFMRCTACDRGFSGYSNLESHVASQRHKEKVAEEPNQLVLLCVQCQLQFSTALKLKEHFLLVRHNDSIPGLSAFARTLRAELRQNQLEYAQRIKVETAPKREPLKSPQSPKADEEAVERVKVE